MAGHATELIAWRLVCFGCDSVSEIFKGTRKHPLWSCQMYLGASQQLAQCKKEDLTDSVLPGAQLRKRRLAERVRDDMEFEDLSSTRRKLLVCFQSSCPHSSGDLAAIS